jgi:hypothetical protein
LLNDMQRREFGPPAHALRALVARNGIDTDSY